jgi:hypothetical protein
MKYIVTMDRFHEVLNVDLIEYLEAVGSLERYYDSYYWKEGDNKKELINHMEEIAVGTPTLADMTDIQRRKLDEYLEIVGDTPTDWLEWAIERIEEDEG